ncbi:ankyrin repeat domain-containing protein [Chitinophaga qingshengii]|uniref:Ankyrin repeat domain-containing protein n=2 Tax=Chitinophaga qingshengii TaxID=1569794 RepID=A0ABR7TXP9_9BACT|nr:ankyrin repeat domain-containing protein [Chitinophaga qingshengii]
MFEGDQLPAVQKMYAGDLKGMVQEIKDRKLNLDQLNPKSGYTLLMYAAIIEDRKAMQQLLEMGADPNIIVPNTGYDTPLGHAVALTDYETLRLLFRYKVNPNPDVGSSPLCTAMMLGGFEGKTERKMIDFLLEHGADINHQSFYGENIMEAAARDDLDHANYFLDKGGNPFVPGTDWSPMAGEIAFTESKLREFNKTNTPYFKQLMDIKKRLIEKYGVTFPPKEADSVVKASIRIKAYEKLSEKDKLSVNFEDNFGEKRYQEDLKIAQGK